MGLIKRHAVSAAVVCLLVAAGLWLFYPGGPARWVFLAAGVAVLLLALILNAREAQTAMGTRTVRYGTGAAVMALLALGIVVAANAISFRHNTRWDLTENKRNSVSPQTIQVLRTLKSPVSAIAFFRSDTPGQKNAAPPGRAPAHPGPAHPQVAGERHRVLPIGYPGQEDRRGPARPVRDLLGRQVHVAARGHRPGAPPRAPGRRGGPRPRGG